MEIVSSSLEQTKTQDSGGIKGFSLELPKDNEEYLYEASPKNWLNRAVDGVRDFLGLKPRRYDFARLIAMEEGKTTADIIKDVGGSVAQANLHHVISSFLNSASFGIIPEDEAIIPDSKSGQVALATASGLSSLAGFVASIAIGDGLISAGSKGVSLFANTSRFANVGEKLSVLSRSKDLVRGFVESSPIARVVAMSIKEGSKLGIYTALGNIIGENEKTNNIYMAIENTSPAVLENSLIGAGFPVIGLINNTFGRMLLALGLGEVTHYAVSGKTNIENILHELSQKKDDVYGLAENIFNIGLNMFFGMVTKTDLNNKAVVEAKNTLDDLAKFLNVKELKIEKPEKDILSVVDKKEDVGFNIKKTEDENIVSLSDEESSIFLKKDDIKDDIDSINKNDEIITNINNIKDVLKENNIKKEDVLIVNNQEAQKIITDFSGLFYSGYKELKNGIKVGLLKTDKILDDKLFNERIKPFFSMMGNKQQLLNTAGYFGLIENGLRKVDRAYDWFAGTGAVSSIIRHINPDVKLTLNELNYYRNLVLKIFSNKEKTEEVKKHLENITIDIGNKLKSFLVKHFGEDGKTSEQIYNSFVKNRNKKSNIFNAFLKDFKEYFYNKMKEAEKLEDSEVVAHYIFYQKNSFLNRMVDVLSKKTQLRIDGDRIVGINVKLLLQDEGYLSKRAKIISNTIREEFVKNFKDAEVLRLDSWENFDKIKPNSFVIFDSEYIDAVSYTGTGLNKELENKNIKQRTNKEEYFKDLDEKIIPHLNDKNIKILITNTFSEDVALEFAKRGFIVYVFERKSARNIKKELVTVNYDKDGNVLKTGKDAPNNTVHLYAGIPINEAAKQVVYTVDRIVNAVTERIDTPASNALILALVNKEFLKYSFDEDAKFLGETLSNITFKVERKIGSFLEKTNEKLEENKAILKDLYKTNKRILEEINKCIVEADVKQDIHPFSVFKEKYGDKYNKETLGKIEKVINNNLDIYKIVFKLDKALKLKFFKKLFKKNKNISEYLKNIYNRIEQELPYYMFRKREKGNVVIFVKDVYGKTLHYEEVLDLTPFILGKNRGVFVKKVIDRIKDKYPGEYIHIEYKKGIKDIQDVGFFELVEFLNDIITDINIDDVAKKEILAKTLKELMAKRYDSKYIKRKRETISGYKEDFLENLETYLASTRAHWTKMLWKDALVEHSVDIHKTIEKNPTLFKVYQNFTEELFRNRDWVDKFIGKAKGFAFIKYLAYNIKNGVVNIFFQTPIFTAMHLASEISKNYIGAGGSVVAYSEAEKILFKSSKDILLGKINNQEKKFLEELRKIGALDAQQTNFTLGKTTLLSKGWNKLLDNMGIFMSTTEKFNREVAALAWIRTNIDDITPENIYKCRNFIYLTNGKYGDLELPFIMQGKDVAKRILRIGFTFQHYNLQMLLGLRKLYGEKQYTTILLGMGTLAMLGGLTSLPMYSLIKALYLQTTGQDLEKDIAKTLNNIDLETFVSSGVFGLMGIDISSSAGLSLPFIDSFAYRKMNTASDLADNVATVVFGVGYQAVKDIFRAVDYFEKGNIKMALYYGIPVKFIANPIRAIGDYFGGVNSQGNLILIDPETKKPLKPDLAEAILQSAGFTPERLSDIKNMYFNYKSLKKYYDNKKTKIRNKIKIAILNKDKKAYMEALKEGFELNKRILSINKKYDILLTPFRLNKQKTYDLNKNFMNFYLK